MIKILKKISNNNIKITFFFVVIFSFFGIFWFSEYCSAGIFDIAANIGFKGPVLVVFGIIAEMIIWTTGTLLTIIIKVLVSVSVYNNYIHEKAIIEAWTIIRDFCNMLFILVLLIIAFATILRIENYNMKKWLPKLLLMAVLINFSRMICGIIIDASQVVMLTFVNSFGGNGASFVHTLKVQDYINTQVKEISSKGISEEWNLFSTIGGLILGCLFIVISLITICTLLIVLVMRMVMLWIYVVVSPLAFLLSSFPGGQKYASQWWSEFINNVITGPVLAFFIWLALVSAGTMGVNADLQNDAACYGTANIMCPGDFLGFLISVGMLIGGLMVTSQIGGMAASVAGKGFERAKNAAYVGSGLSLGNRGLSSIENKAGEIAKSGVVATGTSILGFGRGVDKVIGSKIGMKGGLIGTGMNKVSSLASFDWYKTGRMNKVEANKSLYSFYVKERNIKNNKKLTEDEKDDKIKSLKLSYDGYDYMKNEKGFYRVNKDNKAIDKKGKVLEDENGNVSEENRKNIIYAELDNGRGGKAKLSEMNERQANMFMGYASAKGTSWAAAKKATEEKIGEYQKKIGDSNINADMMLDKINDSSTSGAEKMALALTMAIKDGFKGKTHDDVKAAKATLGSNQLLLKQFNDEMDKKFAHLNYDVKTESGREAFKRRFGAGKIDDVMHESAYEDDNVLQAINEYKGGPEFKNYINKVGKSSKIHKEKLEKGLEKHFLRKDSLFTNENGELNDMRKSMVKLTGNIGKAFTGNVDIKNMEDGLKDLFENFSTKEIANLDMDIFDEKKMAENLGENGAKFFDERLTNAIKENMSVKDISGVRKNPDSTKKLIKELVKRAGIKESDLS